MGQINCLKPKNNKKDNEEGFNSTIPFQRGDNIDPNNVVGNSLSDKTNFQNNSNDNNGKPPEIKKNYVQNSLNNNQADEINKINIQMQELNQKYKTELQSLLLEKCKLSDENIKLKRKIQELNKNYGDSLFQKLQIYKLYNKNIKLQNKFKNSKKSKTLDNKAVVLKNDEITRLNNEISKVKNQIEDLTKPNLVGLDNIGATCYMNATLQSLSNTTKLSEYFLKKDQIGKDKILSHEYQIVIQNLWDRKNHKKSYAPHSFKKVLSKENPLFEGINANDSKDLINFLLERFHLDLNNSDGNNMPNNIVVSQQEQLDEKKMLNIFSMEFKSKYRSIISDLFYGIMETKSQCHGCNNIKYNFQVYSFIEFPLEQVNNYCFMNGLRNNYKSNTTNNPDVNLYECFNYYGKTDLMNGDNQMYCNICRRNCDAFYSSSLYYLPNNLIINLNRGKGAVYKCTVNFPEKLNLLNFVTYQDINTYYELYAVISHLGPSSMSGHFVAYCKNNIDNKWYKYNDSFVDPCKEKEEYRSGMPYILFYKAL